LNLALRGKLSIHVESCDQSFLDRVTAIRNYPKSKNEYRVTQIPWLHQFLPMDAQECSIYASAIAQSYRKSNQVR